MLYSILKNILFRFNPEQVHNFTMRASNFIYHSVPFGRGVMARVWGVNTNSLARTFCGVHFKNPVGLAAGFDKNGKYIQALDGMGFGFLELGTVTPLPQPGNDKPRLFRLVSDQAIINRMGFNNLGVDVLAQHIRQVRIHKPGIIIGGNIGKNKVTPNARAVDDYLACFRQLHTLVDYFVVNVSSPNTPGLRELQDREPLTHILNALQQLKAQLGARQPILLKIAPDLTHTQLDDILAIVADTGIEGIIATNTTISREGLTSPDAIVAETGGLSGRPLTLKSRQVVNYLRTHGKPGLFIIGVGGISTPADALAMLHAGANLIQLYTGFIYQGPGIVKRICNAISQQQN